MLNNDESVIYENVQYSVNSCSNCGRRLTVQEDKMFNPPTCITCAKEHVKKVKNEMTISILLSIVFMVVGIILIRNIGGVLLAGIPYGWLLLNKLTSKFFLWLPVIGWLIYFIVKLVLSYFIGLIALPIKLVQWISQISKVKKLEEILK